MSKSDKKRVIFTPFYKKMRFFTFVCIPQVFYSFYFRKIVNIITLWFLTGKKPTAKLWKGYIVQFIINN
jgi:hypothetical protein